MPETQWLINNRNLYLTVLETGKSKIKEQTYLVSGKGPLPGWSSFSYVLPWQKEQGSFLRPLL